MKQQQLALMYYETLRQDFCLFVQAAFLELEGRPLSMQPYIPYVCDRLLQLEAEGARNLIINMPPRYLKSFIVTICYPAWRLGRDPRTRIISVSYAQDLSEKFARETLRLMQSPFYKAAFPHTRINPKKSSPTEFETTKGGYRLATSVGGVLTGRGGNLIVMDDLIKPADAHSDTMRQKTLDWMTSTLFSRMDDKLQGKMLLVMQRLHSYDPTGYLEEVGGWDKIVLPAIATEDEHHVFGAHKQVFARRAGTVLAHDREPMSVLEKLRQDMGTVNFSAQYQQQPVPYEGNILKADWLHTYDQCPQGYTVYLSWDIAMKTGDHNDYSVCTQWVQVRKIYYLVDVLRVRLEFPELKKLIKETHEFHRRRFGAVTLIEDAGPGVSLIQQLRSENMRPIACKPIGEKKERFLGVTPLFEGGKVLLPRNASWLADFRRELLNFPNGKHDDQVDSVSQFLNWAVDGIFAGVTVGHF